MRQLCLHTAFPIEPASSLLPKYLSGESRLVLENFPELGFFRDIVFTFKLLMVPSSEALPAIFSWMPLDAALTWQYNPADGFIVTGFGRNAHNPLSPAAFQQQLNKSDDSFFFAIGRRMLGIAEKPRAPPSSADPTALYKAEMGADAESFRGKIETEDDVLHLQKLPSFDGALRPRESELLLQYLTVPYLRVPLLLRFFSEPSHVHALGSPKLQAALDAALFEPGLWQAEPVKTQPQRIPAPTRDHLATPAGILFNELTRSPTAVSESILALTTLALELDSGHYNPKSANCAAILYILRVASRVEGFVRTVLAANDQGKAATADLLNSDSWGNHGSMTRGLQCGPEVLTILRRCEGRLATALRRELATMVESWCDDCLAQRKLSSCCTLYAHLAFCYKHIEESELDYNSVSTLLCAHVFLGNNHTFDVEAIGSEGLKKRTPWEVGASDSLLIPATEVFELFARHRGKLLRWLDHHPAQRNVVMEAVVRTVTCTGPRNLFGAAARAALRPRRWVERPGYRGLGRYVPDTAAEAAGDHAAMTEIDEVLKEQKATASKLQAEAKDVSSVAKARTAAAAQAATAPGHRLHCVLRRGYEK